MKFRRYRLIVWKEFLQLRRDPLLLRIVFIMPVLQLILFGYVVGSDITNLPTAIVDHDNTATSRALVQAFVSSGYFKVVTQTSREADTRALFDSTKVAVAIVIDAGTQSSLLHGDTVPVGIVVDGADSKTASVASGNAAQVIAAFNARRLAALTGSTRGPTLNSQVRVLFNPSLKSVNSLVPGLMAAILMITMIAVMSQAVVRERARGTLEQMMVTPLQRGEYLLGKITPYVIIAFLQVAFVAIVGSFWFRVPFHGDVFTIGLGLGLFVFTTIGIGLLISLTSRTQQQAQQTAIFFMIPTIVLSGFMFPLEAMPRGIVLFTYLIPLRYALTVVRGSFLKGASVIDLAVPLLAMAAFSIVIFGIAYASFHKTLGE